MSRSVDNLATSSRRLLVSPVYIQMCIASGVSRLSRIHASLGVQDLLAALIREESMVTDHGTCCPRGKIISDPTEEKWVYPYSLNLYPD